MANYIPSTKLVERVRAGDMRAVSRLISRAEAGVAEARDALAEIYRATGRAHVVGITGVPGSGKSTLVGKITQRLRADGSKVGIVAVDPSSPYSGGAILGDRIRMSELGTDPGVYIRSMATHGATGGLARAAMDVVDILDVAGFDTVILETVGVGQDEVEIARASHTTIVVSAPGLGDEIQAIKAGMLEIADIHVVSKYDRSDAVRTLTDLKSMLVLGARGSGADWRVPVIGTSVVSGEGLDELVDAIRRHKRIAFDTEMGRLRQRQVAEFRLLKTAEAILTERFVQQRAQKTAEYTERLLTRRDDPYALASALIEDSLKTN
jgi:LAO/AO transport system kinase